MRILFIIIIFLVACQKAKNTTEGQELIISSSKENVSEIGLEKPSGDSKFKHYNQESENYIYKLEENQDEIVNAYKVTVLNRAGEKLFDKNIDARPKASKINYCNDSYVEIGFSCGGPCYSHVFVFTDRNKKRKEFTYPQRIAGNSNLIAHIRHEKFERLIIHHLENDKELEIYNPDLLHIQFGQMDTLYMTNRDLNLIYKTVDKRLIKKKISLDEIL